MKRVSLSSHNSGTFPSPATPNRWDGVLEVHKGWSSERSPPPMRNPGGASGLTMPFNSGRAMPSKWEDAERWITSPPVYSTSRASLGQPQRRPKSKSGPLGKPGPVCLSNCSPAAPLVEHGDPFPAGLMMFADSELIQYGESSCGGFQPMRSEYGIARSVSLPGCSDAASKASLPSSQGKDKPEDAEANLSKIVSKRDMATQMSPRNSCSADRAPVFPSSAPLPTSSKLEVRDVEVDGRATIIRWSKKHGARISQQSTPINENYLYGSAASGEAQSSSWAVAEGGIDNMSKYQREEAKITAWENLQKAKAETAIRELEVNLEKKRSSSMDKILRKLRMAQIKAQDMRTLISEAEENQVPKTSHKAASVFKNVQMGVLRGCFTCHAL